MKKKNILITVLGVITLTAGVVAFASCNNGDGGNDSSGTADNSGITKDEDGFYKVTCTLIPAVGATCQSEGNIECWYNKGLDRYFSEDQSNFGSQSLDDYYSMPKEDITTSQTPHDYDENGVCKM